MASPLTSEEKDYLIRDMLKFFSAMPFCADEVLSDEGKRLYRRFNGYEDEDEDEGREVEE